MGHTSFEISVVVAAEPVAVRAFLADLRNCVRTHPLVTRVDTLPQIATGVDRYRVHHRMRVGPAAISYNYLVEAETAAGGDLVFDAYQFPRIRLHNIMRCTPAEAGTLVQEYVDITAPRPLIGFVRREGMQAHRAMLDNLAPVFGNARDSGIVDSR